MFQSHVSLLSFLKDFIHVPLHAAIGVFFLLFVAASAMTLVSTATLDFRESLDELVFAQPGVSHHARVLGVSSLSSNLKALGAVDIDAATAGVLPRVFGTVETLNRDIITGWAFDPNRPREPLIVRVHLKSQDGKSASFLVAGQANIPRPELAALSMRDRSAPAYYGFSIQTPTPLTLGDVIAVYIVGEHGWNPGIGEWRVGGEATDTVKTTP